MTNPIYSGTQEEEILTARTMWASCNDEQVPFSNFSPRYTLLYITAKQTAIDAAEALPNEQQRQEAESTARIELAAFNKKGCSNWQLLKRYIASAYTPEFQQTKWNAAGMADYLPSTQENWQSSKTLLRLGNDFITANLATLIASDNMPPAFATTFSDSKDDFDGKLIQFIAAEQTNTNGAQTKVDAINAIHTDLIVMGLDGQEINSTNEALKKQFVYESVLKLYAGNGNQGYKGNVKDSVTNLPIKNVKITIIGTVHSTLTDAAGNYAMKNVAHATDQSIKAECEGYQTLTIPGNAVAKGSMSTLNITLVPNP